MWSPWLGCLSITALGALLAQLALLLFQFPCPLSSVTQGATQGLATADNPAGSSQPWLLGKGRWALSCSCALGHSVPGNEDVYWGDMEPWVPNPEDLARPCERGMIWETLMNASPGRITQTLLPHTLTLRLGSPPERGTTAPSRGVRD